MNRTKAEVEAMIIVAQAVFREGKRCAWFLEFYDPEKARGSPFRSAAIVRSAADESLVDAIEQATGQGCCDYDWPALGRKLPESLAALVRDEEFNCILNRKKADTILARFAAAGMRRAEA
jgi:hypothetical protein